MVNMTIKRDLRFKASEVIGFSFMLYLCVDLLRAVLRVVLGVVGLSGSSMLVSLVIVYVPILLLCFVSAQFFQKDFIILLTFLFVFFFVSYLIHPDHEYWFTREYWGAWDYVFRPDNGLYIFLFLMLLNDPNKILKYLKTASVIMVIYYAYRLIPFIRNGYWLSTRADGTVVHSAYNLEYGYDVLLYDLTLVYCALKEKKLINWIMAGLGLVCITLGGSRGPFLCLMVFFSLYFGMAVSQSRKKTIYILLTVIIGVTLYGTYQYILSFLALALNKFGLSSRIIRTLIMGTVSNDNGRIKFWNTTIDMIKQNPFGYGATGTRHVLSAFHTAGYPHNFFLELIADLGVFLGGGLSIFFVVRAIAILRMKDNEEWKGLFIIFFGMFFQLMISATFYHRTGFWGLLAIGICIYRNRRSAFFVQEKEKVELI